MKSIHTPCSLLLALFVAGCGGPEAPPAPAEPDPQPAETASSEAPDPGSLKVIMIGLEDDMGRVQTGLWTEDYAAIRAGASAIADHPHVSAPELQRVRGILGEDFPRFVAADRNTHETALRLSEAGTSQDMDAVLRENAALEASCVSCHAQFRQRLTAE